MNKIQHNQIYFSIEFTEEVPNEYECGEKKLIIWMNDLIKSLDMKVVLPPRFYYVHTKGNEGWTGGCNIETSHMAIHIWDNPEPDWVDNQQAKLMKGDLYTCGNLNSEQIQLFIDSVSWLKPIKIDYAVIDRSKNFKLITTNTLDF